MRTERTAVAILPVRLDSQRLPGKALLAETGVPLFVHTYRQVVSAGCFERIVVATDSDEVIAAADAAGIESVRTSSTPKTGSERCAEALQKLEPPLALGDVVANVQADWPEVDPIDLVSMIAAFDDPTVRCATLASRLDDPDQVADPNVVKVVRARDGNALYFSRAPIPHAHREATAPMRLRHVGVYAFRRDTLAQLPTMKSSGLAELEGLEQLRLLENGVDLRVVLACGDPRGIETRVDYDQFVERTPAQTSPTAPDS